MMTVQVKFPEIFTTKNIRDREDAALCADGLEAWGLVMSGNKPPDSFGDVLVEVMNRLMMDSATPDAFMEKSKEFI